jgi:hypothetical protein
MGEIFKVLASFTVPPWVFELRVFWRKSNMKNLGGQITETKKDLEI